MAAIIASKSSPPRARKPSARGTAPAATPTPPRRMPLGRWLSGLTGKLPTIRKGRGLGRRRRWQFVHNLPQLTSGRFASHDSSLPSSWSPGVARGGRAPAGRRPSRLDGRLTRRHRGRRLTRRFGLCPYAEAGGTHSASRRPVLRRRAQRVFPVAGRKRRHAREPDLDSQHARSAVATAGRLATVRPQRLWGLERPPVNPRLAAPRNPPTTTPRGMHTAAPAIQSTKSVPSRAPRFRRAHPFTSPLAPECAAPCPLSSVTDILGAFARANHRAENADDQFRRLNARRSAATASRGWHAAYMRSNQARAPLAGPPFFAGLLRQCHLPGSRSGE